MSAHPAETYTQNLFVVCRKLRFEFWLHLVTELRNQKVVMAPLSGWKSENQYGFKACVLEFGDRSRGTAEIN